MSGVKGRSGRRSLPVAHHIASGNYRPSRHGPRPLPGAVAAFSVAAPAAVPATLVDGLGEAGATFVTACWREFADWSTPSLLLLRRSGELVDLELTARAAGDIRLWAQLHKLLLSTLAALDLEA